MRNLCQIFCVKTGKTCVVVLIVCLVFGLTPTAESISVKLRGKIALVGILSGLAYVTHTLVKRDKRAVEKLQLHLGPPDRVIQFERGFDSWRINYYGEQCYLFRNNLFIETVPRLSLQAQYQARAHLRSCKCRTTSPFLIHTPVSRNPKWLQPYPWHPQQDPPLVSSCLYRLGGEGRLRSLSSCSSRKSRLSWWHPRAHRYEALSHPLP